MSINDINHNGLLDVLEQQIQHASTSTISNFATVAKKASEIVDGANKCYFNNVNKSVVFKYGNKPLSSCVQIGTNDNKVKNVSSIQFNDGSVLNGISNNLEVEDSGHYVPSVSALNDELEKYALTTHDHDDRYALINHVHDERYAGINHVHDERYALLNNIVNEIQKVVEEEDEEEDRSLLIPNVDAIREFCADFITPDSLAANSELQELIRGRNAFDVWKEQQPKKYEIVGEEEEEVEYTVNDYLAAIKGDKGDDGLSAFEVWKSQQPKKYDEEEQEVEYTVNDYLLAIKGDKGDNGNNGLSAFEEWKAQQDPRTPDYVYEDFLTDLRGPKDENDKSFWDNLRDIGITPGTAASVIGSILGDYGLQSQIAALQAQITLLEGQVATMLGEQTASEFVDAMDEAKNMTMSLGQYWDSIKSRCVKAVRRIKSIGSSMRASLGGYTHISPV